MKLKNKSTKTVKSAYKMKYKKDKIHIITIIAILIFISIYIIINNLSYNRDIFSFSASYAYLSHVKTFNNKYHGFNKINFLFSNNYYLFDFIMSFFIDNGFIIRLINLLFIIVSLLSIYFISKELNRNKVSAFFSLIIAMLIPSLWFYSFNTFLPASLTVTLYLLSLLYFIRCSNEKESFKKKINFIVFIIFYTLLLISSSIVFILLTSIILYLFSLPIFKIKSNKEENQTILIILGLSIMYYLLKYNKYLYQNIPQQGLSYLINPTNRINNGDFISFIILSGIIPIVFAFYSLYKRLSKNELNRSSLLIFVNFLAILSFFYLRYINKDTISLLIGYLSASLFALFYVDFNSFLRKSILNKHSKKIFYTTLSVLLIFLAFNSIEMTIISFGKTPSNNMILGLKYIKNNYYQNPKKIICSPKTGDLIKWFSIGNASYIGSLDYKNQKTYYKKINKIIKFFKILLNNSDKNIIKRIKKICLLSNKERIGYIIISKNENELLKEYKIIQENVSEKRLIQEITKNIKTYQKISEDFFKRNTTYENKEVLKTDKYKKTNTTIKNKTNMSKKTNRINIKRLKMFDIIFKSNSIIIIQLKCDIY